MSTCDTSLESPIIPVYVSEPRSVEPPGTDAIIAKMGLQKHPEGGYYVETDRDSRKVPNPFHKTHLESETVERVTSNENNHVDDTTRAASTTIYCLLTAIHPTGVFHRNQGRTVHTLHQGRGRYVVIHADGVPQGGKARIETFVVGQDILAGERLQWLVEGGKYKASFLLPTRDGQNESERLLISETVIPGFEFRDHNFMTARTLCELVSEAQYKELSWLLSARN